MNFETILYTVDGPIATITLNRPEQLNTIVPPMPDELEAAMHQATRDPSVKVVILRGAGRSFCGGYNFGQGFHHWDEGITTGGEWDPGKDFAAATAPSLSPTQKLMSVWRAPKPRFIARSRAGSWALTLCCGAAWLVLAAATACVM